MALQDRLLSAMATALPSSKCSLLLLILLPLYTSAQTFRNISLGSSLTAQDDNSFWPSLSGDFAFGFQQIEADAFILAIWFNKIPDKTIVWSANGHELVPRGSTVQLTGDGRLFLNHREGRQVWTADSAGAGVAYAAMLDTGNFVLVNQDGDNSWESFNLPTDTILPAQTFVQGNKLVARYSEKNYSNGRFQFILQTDGNLVLYPRAFPRDSVYKAYWASDTVGSGFELIFNQSGAIYLIAENRTILNRLSTNEESTRDFYQRAILDNDGVLRQYVYPKNTSSRPTTWTTVKFIPEDICMRLTSDTGGGACGFNSYCRIEADGRPRCECPEGYVALDSNNTMNGCKQNFVSQSCDVGSQETGLFHLKEMYNTDWPLSDYEHFTGVTEDFCRATCLGDCFCAVAIFREGECWKKKMPLSNGRINPRVGGKALIKLGKNSTTPGPAGVGSKKKDHSTLILIGSVLLGSSVFLNFVFLLVISAFFFYLNRKRPKILRQSGSIPEMNLRCFTYDELEVATGDFKEELGQGAYATVYKGILAAENWKPIAVKKLDKVMRDGEREFKTEVSAIGRTNHKNLVQLLGFCDEGQNRLLVYEFMSAGSLASFLFGDSRPDWHRRIQIAVGTARGLVYLHEECSTQIIHCDIKPQNILLDDSLTARISDFGLAKLLKNEQTRTMTGIRGTKGYVAPEWFRSIPITVKVDVYSFGIVLLELIFCRRNFEPEAVDETQMILSDWAYDCYASGELHLLVENDGEAMADMKRLEKFVMVAMWCIQEDPSLRPTMRRVTQMLEGAVEIAVPPDPALFIGTK